MRSHYTQRYPCESWVVSAKGKPCHTVQSAAVMGIGKGVEGSLSTKQARGLEGASRVTPNIILPIPTPYTRVRCGDSPTHRQDWLWCVTLGDDTPYDN